jgi:hypothetical protein
MKKSRQLELPREGQEAKHRRMLTMGMEKAILLRS